MHQEQFSELIATVTSRIGARSLDASLEKELNGVFSPGSREYIEIAAACSAAIDAGWMCNREAAGIRYGRVVKPSARTHGFSVDVVDMDNIAGPHHAHPNGEIDLIMPLTADATFDGRGAGWRVYGPNSSHRPTVTGGRALILYLLPAGSIDFTQPERPIRDGA